MRMSKLVCYNVKSTFVNLTDFFVCVLMSVILVTSDVLMLYTQVVTLGPTSLSLSWLFKSEASMAVVKGPKYDIQNQ